MPTHHNYQSIQFHMRRFWLAAHPLANNQIAFLHIIAQFPLTHIAYHTRTSVKTIDRIARGQKPTVRQQRRLQVMCSKVAQEFQRARDFTPRTVNGELMSHAFHSLQDLGRELSRETKNGNRYK